MKQMLLLVNPVAGLKKAAKHLSEIIEVFNRAGYEVRVYITAQEDDADRIAELMEQPLDLVVCCGGDGTLNTTVNVMLSRKHNIPIGYIPAGSTNDFANSLGLPADVVEAAKRIVHGTPNAYDVGNFPGRYFTYVASFGAFTKASYSTAQNIKNSLGHMAYVLEGIQEISKIRKWHLKLETDTEVLEDDYLFGAVCNSTSVGGILTLNPKLVDMGDGKFEVLLIRAPKNLSEVGECIAALKAQTYDCGMITFRSTGRIRITTGAEMLWSLDGERMEGAENILIENLHHRIVLVH
ncbi:MAG: YegS/Rv2252/BmrU family lipid kinase [Lachnospiraceae bacterium]|nr:YegS/Rv2252/BmrU family lipid kinase [Lachnospiraceae bacterium]